MDKFLRNYDEAELKTASEFLSNWLPFLSDGLCNPCTKVLSDRIRSIGSETNIAVSTPVLVDRKQCKEDGSNCSTRSIGSRNDCAGNNDNSDTHSLGSWKDEADDSTEHTAEVSTPSETFILSVPLTTPVVKKSWADMAQEDELVEEEDYEEIAKAFYGNGSIQERGSGDDAKQKVALPRDQREYIRFSSVKRQKDLICLERVNGKLVNILQGLELHAGVFSAAEQKRIVKFVEELQNMGSNGQLKERTYSAPAKWMRGKGRVTLQFGCCYNYATDKNGNPPGILKNELVDPLPHLFKVMIKRLVRWHVLSPSSVPDSCIVNIYDEGDCIPPHIDNHDFVRPFCTVSFLSECEILFGSNLKIVGPGDFAGSFAIPLPVGSVLVLNGNGADVAKHCVPAVPTKRISITFRKMDESKWPFGYVPEQDLQGLQPLPDEVDNHRTPIKYNNNNKNNSSGPVRSSGKPLSFAREERVDSGKGIIGRYQDNNNNNNNGNYSGRGRGFGARYPDNNNEQNSSPGQFSGHMHFSGGARMARLYRQ